MTSFRTVIAGLCLCCMTWSAVADQHAEEYRLKAVLLSKVIDFVYWPDGAGDRYQLCVVGADPFGEHLEAAFRERKNVSLRRLEPAQLDSAACDVAYFSVSQQRNYVELVRAVGSAPVLTISDIPRFAASGGMINLDLVNRRVRFRINQREIEAAGLSVSYKLLQLADLVETEAAG